MILLEKVMFYSLTWAVFWIPFVGVPHGVICKNFMDLGLELALLCWLIKLVISRKTGFTHTQPNIEKAFLGITAASLLSVPFAVLKIWAIGDFLGLLVGIFSVYLLASAIKTKQQFHFMWNALILGLASAGLLGFIQFFLKQYPQLLNLFWFKPFLFLTSYLHPTRISSTFISLSGVNVYSAYLIAVIPLCLAPLLLQYKKIKTEMRLSGLVILLILFINLILTNGRAAYLALFFSLLYIFFQDKQQRKRLLSLLIGLTIFSVFLIPPVRHTILDIFSTTSSSNRERLEVYLPAVRQIGQRPIFGWGDGHAGRKVILNKQTKQWNPFEVNEYYDPIFMAMKSPQAKKAYYKKHNIVAIQRPHNIYLTTFIELGIIGLLALFYFFYTLIRLTTEYYYRKKTAPDLKNYFLGLAGAFVSVALYGFLHDSLNARPYAILFWVLIALTISLIKLADKKSKAKTRR